MCCEHCNRGRRRRDWSWILTAVNAVLIVSKFLIDSGILG